MSEPRLEGRTAPVAASTEEPVGTGIFGWPTEVPVLVGGPVTLRAWTDLDVDAVHRSCQDPDIQRWMDVPVPFRWSDAADFVRRSAEQWTSQAAAPFAVVAAGTPDPVGSCGLVGIDPTARTAQVVYALDPGARGRGIAVRAARLLCRWAFEQLGMGELQLHIGVGNGASLTVARHLGCREGGAEDGWIVCSLRPSDLTPG